MATVAGSGVTDSDTAGPGTVVSEMTVLVRPGAVAVTEFAPTAVPSVHEPSVATPFAAVEALEPVIVPPPAVMLKVTATPATAFPFASRAVTLGTGMTDVPTTAAAGSALLFTSCVATPAIPVAVNVTGASLSTCAVSTLAPAVVPSVQLVTDATPLVFVVVVPPATEPPPDVTLKVTAMPAIPA